MKEIIVYTGEYKETKQSVLVSDYFMCCVGIYTMGFNFASLGHIWTSTSYEFDLEYGHANKIYQAINTIAKNIDEKPIFWGIIRGIEPYGKNNPNMIMLENSLSFMDNYFEGSVVNRLRDLQSRYVKVDFINRQITTDSGSYYPEELLDKRKVKIK